MSIVISNYANPLGHSKHVAPIFFKSTSFNLNYKYLWTHYPVGFLQFWFKGKHYTLTKASLRADKDVSALCEHYPVVQSRDQYRMFIFKPLWGLFFAISTLCCCVWQIFPHVVHCSYSMKTQQIGLTPLASLPPPFCTYIKRDSWELFGQGCDPCSFQSDSNCLCWGSTSLFQLRCARRQLGK